ncbi:hypothetical protein AAFN85_03260 [Mucilaginibacter sp. CAU 1740]|uniref:hypothetical protein n=1 Tax=Mucilaginibacter sp. CAU 1740 TaxID=3140365 RepID=UPI00325B0B6C
MKKHIFTILAVIFGIAASGQTRHRSQKTSFKVQESDTEYTIRSSFPAERAEKFRFELIALLGKSDSENRWSVPAYTAVLSADHFEASLDKGKATGSQLGSFKKLAGKLRAALDQPETPKQP